MKTTTNAKDNQWTYLFCLFVGFFNSVTKASVSKAIADGQLVSLLSVWQHIMAGMCPGKPVHHKPGSKREGGDGCTISFKDTHLRT